MSASIVLVAVASAAACDSDENKDVCGAATGARADVTVQWGVALDVCDDGEICEHDREAACTVGALSGDGPIVVTLDCEYAGVPATDVVTIDIDPGGEIDLSVGAAVTLAYSGFGAFEAGGHSTLRITDEAGLVFAHTSGELFGGLTGQPDWGQERVVEAVAPLKATRANAGCDDDDARNFVTISSGGASIDVPSGASGTLTAASAWLVVLEASTRTPGDVDDERIDLAVMRLRP